MNSIHSMHAAPAQLILPAILGSQEQDTQCMQHTSTGEGGGKEQLTLNAVSD